MLGLIIRDQQMQTFAEVLLGRWIRDYLVRCYPHETREIGPQGLREFVGAWIKKARAKGFLTDPEIRRFVHIAFLLGPDFEQSPETLWARRILDDTRYKNPGDRLQALEEVTLQYLKNDEEAEED